MDDIDYYGYFTLYHSFPLMRGRTHLRPDLFIRDAQTLQCESKVHLFGKEYKVKAFPSTGQDGRYFCCAHASIWSLLRYYSEKYTHYREWYFSDIVNANLHLETGRNVPTKGLYGFQIINILDKLGMSPIHVGEAPVLNKLYGYLQSGFPIIVCTKKHAVVGIGMTGNPKIASPGESILRSSSISHCDYNDCSVICADDNFFPNGIIAEPPDRTRIKPTDIVSIIIPLYEKIMIEWENAEEAIKAYLEDPYIGLAIARSKGWLASPTAPTVVRLFLTSSKSYKMHLFATQPTSVASILIRSNPLPKFVWIAECRDLNQEDKIICEIVLDATASKYDKKSYIYIRYPNIIICNKRWESKGRTPKTSSITITPEESIRLPFPGNLK